MSGSARQWSSRASSSASNYLRQPNSGKERGTCELDNGVEADRHGPWSQRETQREEGWMQSNMDGSLRGFKCLGFFDSHASTGGKASDNLDYGFSARQNERGSKMRKKRGDQVAMGFIARLWFPLKAEVEFNLRGFTVNKC